LSNPQLHQPRNTTQFSPFQELTGAEIIRTIAVQISEYGPRPPVVLSLVAPTFAKLVGCPHVPSVIRLSSLDGTSLPAAATVAATRCCKLHAVRCYASSAPHTLAAHRTSLQGSGGGPTHRPFPRRVCRASLFNLRCFAFTIEGAWGFTADQA